MSFAAFAASFVFLGFVLASAVAEDGDPAGAAVAAGSPTAPVIADRTLPLDQPATALVEDAVLQAAILAALGDAAADTGVVVRRLSDGRGATLNPGLVFYAASTFKLAVLYEAERRASAGELDLESLVLITEADAAEDLGTIGGLPLHEDGTLTIREALEAMITHSDNASAVALMRLLGSGNIDATLASLGLTATSVNTEDLPATAGDMALLMQAIVRGAGVSGAAREEMRGFLLGQVTRSGIPAGLPADVPVGNKTGTWDGATHDVAFVEAPSGTYVIAVLSGRGWDWEPVARVSAAVYEVLTGR